MDWGAALAGLDSELQQRIKNNTLQHDDSLNVLTKTQDIRNQGLTSQRLADAEKAREDYYKDQIDVKRKDLEAKASKYDEGQATQADMRAAVEDYANETNPELKRQKGALLLKYHIKIAGQGNPHVLKVLNRQGKVINEVPMNEGDSSTTLPSPPSAATQGPIINLSPEALKGMADAARTNPGVVSLIPGRGNAGISQRNQVLNAAFAGAPDDFNLAVAQSDYAANKAAESALTKAVNINEPYHKTAQQNFGIMMDRLKRIPDLGSPEFNKPIRQIASNLFGDADIKAFEVARTTALREYNRIVSSNPSLAGQIHQKSMDDLNDVYDNGMTLGQAVEAMKVANQDMDNVMRNLNEQVGTIRATLKGSGQKPTAGAEPAGAAAPAGPPAGAKILKYNPKTGKFE